MYKIVMKSCSVEHEYMSGLTYEEALETCEDMHWVYDAGFVWDLYIEEDD